MSLAGLAAAALIAGLAVLVALYAALLARLRSIHPETYAALGSPTLLNGSPRRSLALQCFVYRGSRSPGVGREVRRLCRLVGLLTPLYLLGLGAVLGWFWLAAVG